MATVNTDRNLLFGILALQMDFISRDALIVAMSAWAVAKNKHIGRILVEQGVLTESRYTMLDALVEEHLKLHGNDPQRSLAAVSAIGSVRQDLEQIADAELHASLAHVPAAAPDHDANATRPPSMGVSTSTGLRFRVVRPHAKGGLGVVSVARDEELHREVALKEIQGEHADNPQSRARFVLEAEITGGLEHPGIVPVYGLGHDPTGRPFYAMRFIRGNSLHEAIERFHHAEKPGRDPGERALALRELLGRFVDVCNAIAYAHSRGVLHRDLKPGNIMLGQYGETLVVDWGLAKPLGRSEEAARSAEGPLTPASGSGVAPTQLGSAIGTPQYMSPEQAAGRLDRLGPASDVYSLGATLYCLLTGRAPFDDADVGTVLQKVQQGNFPPPRSVKGRVVPCLEAICLKGMALKPEDRYPTPRALADDVEHWLADEPVSAWREPLVRRVRRWARRHKAPVAAAAAGLLVAVLAGGVGLWWLEKQRAEQQARRHETDQKALQALQRARGLLEQGWQANDLVKLKAAQVEADGAAEIAHSGAAAEAVQQEAVACQHEVEKRLARAEKNRVLLQDLLDVSAPQEIRTNQSDPSRLAATLAQPSVDEQYAAAFRRRWDDLDIDLTEEAEAVARLQAEPEPVVAEILAGLDSWMLERQRKKQSEARWRRLFRVAGQVDQNGQRRQLRVLLAGESPPDVGIVAGLTGLALPWTALWELEHGARWRHLVELRGQVKPAREPVLSVVLLAQVCRAEGDAAGAESVLRQAVTARPSEVVLLDALARLLEERGRLDEAIEYYRAARALRPQSGVALALALSKAGRVGDGEAVLRDLTGKQPNNPEMHFSLGYILWEQNKLAEAEAAFRKAIGLQPDLAVAYHNLGVALHQQKKLAEAEAAFRKAIALQPEYAKAYYNLGTALRDQKKVGEAEAAYRKAIALNPDDAKAYYNLGNALRDQKKVGEAEAAYRKAIDLKPDYADAYCNLGVALDDQKKLAEAEAAYRKAITLRPDDAKACYNLGNALWTQKKLAEAEAAYRKAITLRPDLAEPYAGLGNALRDQKKLAEAEAAFRKAITLKPDFALAYYNLGATLRGQTKLDEAVTACRKAIALQPDCAEAYGNLGNALYEQKKLGEAEVAYLKAIALQPDLAGAYNGLGATLYERKKLDEAVAAFRKADQLLPDHPVIRSAFRQAERLLQVDQKLAACLAGKERPGSPQEATELAGCAAYREHYRAAARFYADAFKDDQKLADNLQALHRYNAACCAALAAAGKGKDVGALGEPERATLRRQALDWLRADLKAYSGLLEKNMALAPVVRQRLAHWFGDTDLAGVRAAATLAKLPDTERDAWRKLWADVEALCKRIDEK